MLKKLFTFALTLILLFTITAPTIMSLSDYDICETSLILDIEEDTESNEKSEEVKELKIIGIPVSFGSIYQYTPKEKIITLKSDTYQTIYHNLECPPPEFS